MSTPSQVETIFFGTLDRETTVERARYLDEACGGDAELRRRVERLLEAHPQAADFLARPAVARQEFEPFDSVEPTLGADPAGACQHRTMKWPTPSPSCGPRSSPALGRLAHY